MIFLWASLLPLFVAAIFFLLRYLLRHKKEQQGFLFYLEEAIPDAISTLLFSLIFALLIHLLFAHYKPSSTILFFLAESALCDWLLPLHRVIEAIRKKSNSIQKEYIGKNIRDILLALTAVLEVFAFHASSYGNRSQETQMAISHVASLSILREDNSVDWENGSALEIDEISTDNTSFYLDFENENLGVQIRYRTKESEKADTAYSDFQTYNVDLAYPEDTDFPVNNLEGYSSGSYNLQLIIFYNHSEQISYHAVHLKSVYFRAPIAFTISYLRLFSLQAMILLLYGAKKGFTWEREQKEDPSLKPKRHLSSFSKSMIVAGSVSLAGLVGFLILTLLFQKRYYTSYPFDASLLPESGLPLLYYNLFDALKHGQFALLVKPDPILATLDNPYDVAARSESGAQYLWDCAYYKGNYYCYFGIGPCLFIMFPVYWLSGMNVVPTGSFLIQFAILVTGLEFLFLGPVFNKATGEKVSYPMSFFLGILSFFASAFPLMLKDNSNDWQYWIAFDWGIANLIAFLGLTLSAYNFPKARIPLFPIIGFVFVALLLSRPDLCFSVLVLAPLFFRMMFDKSVSVKKRIISFASMFAILFAGIFFAFYYNYKRFGSVTEFGSSYQLTVMDQTKLHLTGKGILAGFFHFLLQPWYIDFNYPYVQISVIQTPISYHDYTIASAGMFTGIFSCGIFLALFLWKDAGWDKRISYILMYLALPLYAGLVYSFSGNCPRYCISFWMIGSFVTLYFTFRTFATLKNKETAPKLLRVFFCAAFFAGFLGLFFPLRGYSNGHFGYGGLGDNDIFGYPEVIRRFVNSWHL